VATFPQAMSNSNAEGNANSSTCAGSPAPYDVTQAELGLGGIIVSER
jgi:hypothetical protein